MSEFNLMTIPSAINRLTSLLSTASVLATEIANNHWQTEVPLPEEVAINLQVKLEEIGASLVQARNYVKSEAEPAIKKPATVLNLFEPINHGQH